MAQQDEPMDIDISVCDFDNKENSLLYNNVLPKTPSTEKGYEELDASELNMRLRYSITPSASPMTKSLTANCTDKTRDITDTTLNTENNLTRSLNVTVTNCDSILKGQNVLPLQPLSTDTFIDGNRNPLRPLDAPENITLSVVETLDTMSLPSSSSSMADTPEATTPTKDMPKDGGQSPIMRRLKSVLNMFRPSQSPIPATGHEATTPEALSPPVINSANTSDSTPQVMLVSTPLAAQKDGLSKRSSQNRDSIVFKDDLEKELQWTGDDSAIVFSHERIPVHRLFFQNPSEYKVFKPIDNSEANLDSTVEYMDISYNTTMKDSTVDVLAGINAIVTESDGEFEDCESTFTKSHVEQEIHLEFTSQDNNTDVNTQNPQTALEIPTGDLPTAEQNQSIEQHSIQVKDESILTENLEVINTIQIERSITVKNEEDILSERQKVTEKETVNDEIATEVKENAILNEHDLLSEKQEDTTEQPIQIKTIDKETIHDKITTETKEIAGINDEDLLFERQEAPISESTEIKSIEKETIHKEITTDINEIAIKNDEDLLSERQEATTNEPSELKTIEETANDELVTEIKEISVTSGLEQEIIETDTDRQGNVTQIIEMNMELHTENINSENPEAVNVFTSTTQGINEIKEATVASDTQHTEPEINIQIENTLSDVIQQAEEEDRSIQNQENNIVQIEQPLNFNNHDNVSDVIANNVICQNLNTENSCVLQTLTNTFDLDPYDNIPVDDIEVLPLHEVVSDGKDILATDDIKNVPQTYEKVSDVSLYVNTLNKTIDVESNVTKSCAEMHTDEKVDEVSLSGLSTHPVINEDIPALDIINAADIGAHNNVNVLDQKTEEITSSMIEECILSEYNENAVQMMELEKEIENQVNITHDNSFVENVASVYTSIPEENVIPLHVAENSAPNLGFSTITSSLDVTKDKDKLISSDLKHDEHGNTIEINTVCENTKKIKELSEVNLLVESNTGEDKIENVMPHDDIESTTNMITSNPIQPLESIDISFTDVLEVINNDTNLSENIKNKLMMQGISQGIEVVSNSIESASCHTFANIPKEDIAENKKSNESIEKNNAEDEEIITSEGNSPFVSVSADDEMPECQTNDAFEEIENPVASKSKIQVSPPTSPAIISKGYNFNFDEIDDPFATKTKIRMSPTGDSPVKLDEPPKSKNDLNRNSRKVQPGRKKPAFVNKKLNSTIAGKARVKQSPVKESATPSPSNQDFALDEPAKGNKQRVSEFLKTSFEEKDKAAGGNTDINSTVDVESAPESEPAAGDKTIEVPVEETKSFTEPVTIIHEVKSVSSSEQSTYYSANTSSNEDPLPTMKSSFNLPEIIDPNFNQFSTKSHISQSPPPSLDVALPVATSSKILTSEEEINFNPNATITMNDSQNQVNDASVVENRSTAFNATASSKESDDENVTVQEVHTDNEDTIEGPFLDMDNDMMQFTKPLPVRMPINEDENADGELFIDAETFEFLLNKNQPTTVADSGKESLFLKFDPLFAKRMSSDVFAALNQHRQSLNCAPSPDKRHIKDQSSVAGPSILHTTQDIEADNATEESFDDLNVTVSKPMMVVSPAVNPVPSPRKTLSTPNANRRSLTFTSPAIAVIDRLLSMSANNSFVAQDTTVAEVTRENNEADLALTQLRELLADKEISVYNLRSERKQLQDRLSTLESQLKSLEQTSEERLKKINELSDTLTEKSNVNNNMAKVVEEYERTISSLISEIEQDKKRHAEERAQLIQDRDEQAAHLASMEVSFNDLHSKYEKSKQVILGLKTNEDSCLKSIKEFEENLVKMQSNYELLKQHATAKLNHANEELQKINRAHDSEVLKLNAMIKRKEMHITSLEETLQQKTKANDELTAICDELISRVN